MGECRPYSTRSSIAAESATGWQAGGWRSHNRAIRSAAPWRDRVRSGGARVHRPRAEPDVEGELRGQAPGEQGGRDGGGDGRRRLGGDEYVETAARRPADAHG